MSVFGFPAITSACGHQTDRVLWTLEMPGFLVRWITRISLAMCNSVLNINVIKPAFFSVVFVTGLPGILEEQSISSIFYAPKDFSTVLQTVQGVGITKPVLR